MKQYNIDWKSVVKLMVKFRLNKPKRMGGIWALVYPLHMAYNGFYNFLLDKVYELSKTPQVVYLESVLNDRWDAGLRRIRVIDASSLQPMLLYRVLEGKTPPYIYRESEGEPAEYIYREQELNALTPDFKILVPVFVEFDQDEMIALVNRYKLSGKFFVIETF